MPVTIEPYTKDKIPDVLDFERRLRHEGVDTLIALTAENDEAQRFYRSVPDSQMRDTGIWIDIR